MKYLPTVLCCLSAGLPVAHLSAAQQGSANVELQPAGDSGVRLPAEEFYRIASGSNLGWPYTYWDPIRDARMIASDADNYITESIGGRVWRITYEGEAAD